jgi:orotidine-5'-phosphate decarboxylase
MWEQMNFNTKLNAASVESNSLVCVGLDTDISKIPKFLLDNQYPVFEFNKRIINTTKDLVCAYKLNMAFYEMLGLKGIASLQKTIKFIPREIPIILDAKRGDIGNTAEAYAKAIFETMGCDATTVNPYMGYDSVKPFLEYKNKGIFILCRTSNEGAKDFQDLICKKPLYQIIAEKVKKWNEYSNCGIVAGATFPEELKIIRNIVGNGIPILIPGVGTQGGEIEKVVRFGTNPDGKMAIINSSRAIIYSSSNENFAETAREQTSILRDSINNIRKRFFKQPNF